MTTREETSNVKLNEKSLFVVSTDLETGYDDDGQATIRTSREDPVEVEYLYNYLPCVYSQLDPSTVNISESKSGHIEQALSDENSVASVSASLGFSNSESMIRLSKTESGMEDSKPPPLISTVTTSDTEGDDESEERQSSCKSPGNRSHTDPFAPRVGKTLCWRNVNMTLVSL
jgi:hypothetical protein